MEAKAKYDVLSIHEHVRAKIPQEGAYMVPIDPHTLMVEGKPVEVEPHWQNGMPPDQERKFLIQRNFYGFSREDLGKARTATVRVTHKVTPGGWNVLLLDITKELGTRATTELKLRIGDNTPMELRPFREAPVHLDFAPTKA